MPAPASGKLAIQIASESVFEIGSLSIRPALCEVEHAGRAERLEPRVMAVLIALGRRPNSVVTRAELRLACWGDVSVSEDALNRTVSRLRALSDRLHRPFRIETRSKVGYRLVPAAPHVLARNAGARPSPLPPASSGRARDLHARALQALEQPGRDQVEQAVAYLAQAVALEPEHAPSWCALAEAQRLRMLYFPPLRQPPRSEEARNSARRALALQPGLGDAFGILANLIARFGRWSEIEALFLQGLSASPHSNMLRQEYARFLLAVGRTAEGVGQLEAVQAANPLNAAVAVELAAALIDAGRGPEGLLQIDAAYTLWPTIMLVWSERVRLNLMGGDLDVAEAMLRAPPPAVRADDPNLARRRLHLTAVRSRRREDIDAARANFLAFAELGLGPATVAIHALTTLQEDDCALQVADGIFRFDAPQARRVGVNMMNTYALGGQADATVLFRADTAAIRRSQGFHAILERIGLTEYWAARGSPPDFMA